MAAKSDRERRAKLDSRRNKSALFETKFFLSPQTIVNLSRIALRMNHKDLTSQERLSDVITSLINEALPVKHYVAKTAASQYAYRIKNVIVYRKKDGDSVDDIVIFLKHHKYKIPAEIDLGCEWSTEVVVKFLDDNWLYEKLKSIDTDR